MCIKNLSPDAIETHVNYLRCTTGRKSTKPLPGPVVSRNQSIQGYWDPSVPLQRMTFTLNHE
jgi:hypothetical protein